jgi:hypothetical protein
MKEEIEKHEKALEGMTHGYREAGSPQVFYIPLRGGTKCYIRKADSSIPTEVNSPMVLEVPKSWYHYYRFLVLLVQFRNDHYTIQTKKKSTAERYKRYQAHYRDLLFESESCVATS